MRGVFNNSKVVLLEYIHNAYYAKDWFGAEAPSIFDHGVILGDPYVGCGAIYDQGLDTDFNEILTSKLYRPNRVSNRLNFYYLQRNGKSFILDVMSFVARFDIKLKASLFYL